MTKPKIVQVPFGRKAPDGLAADLRALADAVDRGEVTEMVGAFVKDGEYGLMFGASIVDSLVLATLLHDRSVGRFKE